jgi:hypothetical protein
MNVPSRIVALTLAGFALAGLSSVGVSARIVCNADGDCWHVHDNWAYPPAAGVIFIPTIGRGGTANATRGASILAAGTGEEAIGKCSE